MSKTKTSTLVLGVVCIVLVASLIIVVANGPYFNKQPDIQDLEKQITNLQNQVNSLNNLVSDYEQQNEELTNTNDYYASIIALEESMIILDAQTYTQEANIPTVLLEDQLDYAGYIKVQIESTSETSYIQTSYTYKDVEYTQTIPVGTNGTAHFPILPGIIEILLGNTTTETNTATITMTYFY